MTPDLLDLNPTLRNKVAYLLQKTTELGLEFELFAARRTPEEQAMLWKKSRGEAEILRAVEKMYESGAVWLAGVLATAPRPYGRWETNQLPGQSWHQWGEAVKVRLVSDTMRVVWNPNHVAYEKLALIARQVNLYPGYLWKNRDAQHVQLRADQVRAYYAWSDIDRLMKEIYDAPVEFQQSHQAG